MVLPETHRLGSRGGGSVGAGSGGTRCRGLRISQSQDVGVPGTGSIGDEETLETIHCSHCIEFDVCVLDIAPSTLIYAEGRNLSLCTDIPALYATGKFYYMSMLPILTLIRYI